MIGSVKVINSWMDLFIFKTKDNELWDRKNHFINHSCGYNTFSINFITSKKNSLRLSDKNHLINLDKEDQKSTKFQRRKAKNCLTNNKLKTKKCPKFYFWTTMQWIDKSFFAQLPPTPLSHIHIYTHPRTLKCLVTPRSCFYTAG